MQLRAASVPLILTPSLLRTSYDMMAHVESIAKIGVPDVDDVKFEVAATDKHFAWADWDGICWTIHVSQALVGTLLTLNATMAHEDIHISGHRMGVKHYRTHGAWFKKLARPVCDECGFDPLSF